MTEYREHDPAFVPKSREPVIHNGLCYILLNNGQIAFCDETDFDLVSQHKKWSATSTGYAYFRQHPSNKAIRLHQFLNPDWIQTDHINRNRLDSRRVNLRECSNKQNMMNRAGWGSGSCFKGVAWKKQRNLWIAQIKVGDKRLALGQFNSEIEAAKAYDFYAKQHYGKFAYLNFPEESVMAN